MYTLGFGPYIGDFKYEIMFFKPFINWVENIINPENIIISSHFNRKFLYKDYEYFFEVNPIYTVDVFNQKKNFIKYIFKLEYKNLENEFINKCSKIDKNFWYYNISYNRNDSIPISIYQQLHKKIKYKNLTEYNDKVIFIPDRLESEENLFNIYKNLKKYYGNKLIVIGDGKCWLHDFYNISSKNYLNDIYENMIDIISSSKLIITPTSHWTYLANLQNKPVISFGIFNKQYKKKGLYNFNNRGIYLPKINNKKTIETILTKMEIFLC